MEESKAPEVIAKQIWTKHKFPVIVNRRGKKLLIRLPKYIDAESWLHKPSAHSAKWEKEFKCWELPERRLTDLIEKSLNHFGELHLIQKYKESEICSYSCRHAQYYDCACSCMGANHGQGDDGTWFDIGEALSFRKGEEELAIRHMRKKHDKH